jgi:hypothetical protein
MFDKTKRADIARNCAIALLFVSAAFLLLRVVFSGSAGLSDELGRLFSGKGGTSSAALPGEDGSGPAAGPVFLMTTTEDGAHDAVKCAGGDKEKIVSQFSAYLGEALGSPADLAEVGEDAWRKALTRSGVFFDYLYPQPLSVLASWLGTEVSVSVSEKSARRLLLAEDNGGMALYFMSAGENRIYSCKTAVSFAPLAARLREFPAGSAQFAFELGEEYEGLDPYFIFSGKGGPLRKLSAANPVREGFDAAALMGGFSMNSRVASQYSEPDGSVVYVDGDKSLRLEASGGLVFSTSGGGLPLTADSEPPSLSACISACLKIAGDSLASASGDAEISLADISGLLAPGDYTVTFVYFADGIPVLLPDTAYAARFEIRGGALTRAELRLRSFAFTGETVLALPERQAAAIAAEKGGEPVLIYEDRPDGVVCTWIMYEE